MDFNWVWGIPSAVVQESIPRTAIELLKHRNIACSISGGADSDVMLDIVTKLDTDRKVRYVFFDTGIEMDATKRHIKFLESKYGISIEILRPKVPVALAVKKDGYPFLSKNVSEYISRLQKYSFTWTDEPFEELYRRYPRCKAALRWWCNDHGNGSHFNISAQPYLKEFMIENPPNVLFSPKCCGHSKKKPSDLYVREHGIDLLLIGIRKAEGGARAFSYKSCIQTGRRVTQYFPLFWFKDKDKKIYESACNAKHSDAYTVYGCKRTGCAGCPFGSGFEEELKMLEKYEPQLYKAVSNIFAPAYEYTRAYRKFRSEMQLSKTGNSTK